MLEPAAYRAQTESAVSEPETVAEAILAISCADMAPRPLACCAYAAPLLKNKQKKRARKVSLKAAFRWKLWQWVIVSRIICSVTVGTRRVARPENCVRWPIEGCNFASGDPIV